MLLDKLCRFCVSLSPSLFFFCCCFFPLLSFSLSYRVSTYLVVHSYQKDARLASAAHSSFELLTPASTTFAGQNIQYILAGTARKASASNSRFGDSNSQLHVLIAILRGGA